MAYYYTSNQPESLDNYQYYQHYYNYNHDFNNQVIQEPRYVQYCDSEYYGNAYQQALTPSLVGYYYSNYNHPESLLTDNGKFHESGEYYDPVSTEYVIYYNNSTPAEAEAEAKATDIDDEENDPNPKPFHGGYDINEKYGKPLPASEEICYPTSKADPNNIPSMGDFSYGSVPSPYVKEAKNDVDGKGEPKQTNGVTASKVIQEENPSDFEEDDYDEEEEEDYGDDDDYDEEEEEEEGEEKQDDMGNEAETEVEPKQADGIIASKVIQEEKPPTLDKGVEKQDDLGKEPSKNNTIVAVDEAVHAKEAENLEGEAMPKNGSTAGEVIQQKKALELEEDFEEEEDEEEDIDEEEEDQEEEKEGVLGDQGSKQEEYGNQIRQQIPPGYGIEALDLCEGVFGGYFPCLWKRNQRVYNHQRDGNDNMSDYDYCWKETAEYLFGNPNPYGGTMPEKGSYGDPVYSYQRYCPQQPLTEQVEYPGGNTSWLQHSRNYGHSGVYQY